MNIFSKIKIKEAKNNQITELLEHEFFVMFIPAFSIFQDSECYKLSYHYPNLYADKSCYRLESSDSIDTQYYQECLRENKLVVFEVRNLGSLIFTNFQTSNVFQILQKHYKEYTNYVFQATDDYGYFKILKNGVISRKIASHGEINGIISAAEVRGKPCEYEIENNRIYKIDMQAQWAKDMLKDFKKKEVFALFDYYVGFEKIDKNEIHNITVYEIR